MRAGRIAGGGAKKQRFVRWFGRDPKITLDGGRAFDHDVIRLKTCGDGARRRAGAGVCADAVVAGDRAVRPGKGGPIIYNVCAVDVCQGAQGKPVAGELDAGGGVVGNSAGECRRVGGHGTGFKYGNAGRGAGFDHDRVWHEPKAADGFSCRARTGIVTSLHRETGCVCIVGEPRQSDDVADDQQDDK